MSMLESVVAQIVHPEMKKMQVETVEDQQRAFALLTLVLEIAARAFAHFENGDLRQFDALVGETQCHIRALKVVRIDREGMNGLQARIAQLKSVQEQLFRETEQRGPLLQIARVENPDGGPINSREVFLIFCHLLYLTRGKVDPSESDSDNLLLLVDPRMQSSIEKQDVRDTMFQAKEVLARETVRFVQEISGVLKPFISGDNILAKYSLVRISCYMGIKIVLNQIDKFILKVNGESLFLSKAGQLLDRVEHSGESVLVFESVSTLDREEILKLNIADQFLVSGAHHYQYLNKNDVEIPLFRKLQLSSLKDVESYEHLSPVQIGAYSKLCKEHCSALYKSKQFILQTFLEMERHKEAPRVIEVKHVYVEKVE